MEEGEKKWLKTRIIIELLGKPLEHMEKTLVLLGDAFCDNLPEAKVIKKKVRPPVLMEGTDMYSAFFEFEVDVKNLGTLIGIIFDYMPSSVEIIEPEELVDTTISINGLLNDLAIRLHQYDDIIKKFSAQNELQKRILAKARIKLEKLSPGQNKELELPGKQEEPKT